MSISDMATTWTPSKHACMAQKGSHRATNTRAPEPTESESANLANTKKRSASDQWNGRVNILKVHRHVENV